MAASVTLFAPPTTPLAHPMTTQMHANMHKVCQPTDCTILYFHDCFTFEDHHALACDTEPTTYKDALHHHELKISMDVEFGALL